MSSSTQLLDSDCVNEWSELLNNEQELPSSLHHHHNQILENGCYLPPNPTLMKQKKSPLGNGVHSNCSSASASVPNTTTSWIELKSSTKCKAPPIPESLDAPKSMETIVHKSIRPAPAIPPNVRRKEESTSTNEGSHNSGISSPITRQPPPRSGSVSRGLQVEEEDLIQFSELLDFQHGTQHQSMGGCKSHPSSSEDSSSMHHRSLSSGRRRPPGRPDIPSHSSTLQAKKANGETNGPLDEEDGAEDYEDDDNASNRTADEQMDYLESLEPCPCYAKCCLDSIITLFCVTLLG